LKSDRTESAHLLDVAQSYALSRAGLRLTFRDSGREVLAVEGRHDFQTRVFKVLGRGAAEGLTPLAWEREGLSISGWLGAPDHLLASTARLFIYVLGRPVRDRLLNRALAEGYGRLLSRGTWPAAVIFLDLDPAEVDVNVHPAKAEVRFRRPSAIFSALAEAVAGAVGRAPQASSPWLAYPLKESRPESPGLAPARPEQVRPEQAPPEPPWLDYEGKVSPVLSAEPSSEPSAGAADSSADSSAEASGEPNFEPLRPLAQLYHSYILAEGARGLYMVDQHAAHERVLFNRLKLELARAGLPSQALLLPETLELSPREARAAEKLRPHLARLGFELEPFGEGGGFLLRGAPAILGREDPMPPLLEILGAGRSQADALDGAGLREALEALADKWLYSLACRAAIKAGEKMSLEAMTRLLEDMAREPHGAYCPHGRPAIQLIERGTIERRFDRR